MASKEKPTRQREMDVVIIGAGFSGLLSCMKLKQLGMKRIVLLERGDRVGGTWAFNVYPGVACDVRSYHYLPLHYLPNYAPERNYSTGEEILHFIDRLVEAHDLGRHIELGKSVTTVRWNSDKTWTTCTDQGDEITSRFVVVSWLFCSYRASTSDESLFESQYNSSGAPECITGVGRCAKGLLGCYVCCRRSNGASSNRNRNSSWYLSEDLRDALFEMSFVRDCACALD